MKYLIYIVLIAACMECLAGECGPVEVQWEEMGGGMLRMTNVLSDGISLPAREWDESIGTYCGIGAGLAATNQCVTIKTIYANSPASRAGLYAGDIVCAVDAICVDYKPTKEVASLIRGEAGTMISLVIEREMHLMTVTVERAVVKLPTYTNAPPHGRESTGAPPAAEPPETHP